MKKIGYILSAAIPVAAVAILAAVTAPASGVQQTPPPEETAMVQTEPLAAEPQITAFPEETPRIYTLEEAEALLPGDAEDLTEADFAAALEAAVFEKGFSGFRWTVPEDKAAPLSRERAAEMLLSAAEAMGEDTETKKAGISLWDLYQAAPDSKEALVRVCALGLLGLDETGAVRPGAALTREEAAGALHRLLEPSARLVFEEEDAPKDIEYVNMMFLGDSMIANPHLVSDLFCSKGHQVIAGGGATIGQFLGITTGKVYVGAEQLGGMLDTLMGKEFNGIVIELGANNMGGQQTPEQVFDQYRRLLEELTGAYDVPVFALRVFPVSIYYDYRYGDGDARMDRTDAFSALVAEYCAGVDDLYFVDATVPFQDENGDLIPDYGAGDGLHINGKYYDLFYEAIESAIRETGRIKE